MPFLIIAIPYKYRCFFCSAPISTMLILHVRFTVDSLVRDFKFDMMTFLNRTQKRDFH